MASRGRFWGAEASDAETSSTSSGSEGSDDEHGYGQTQTQQQTVQGARRGAARLEFESDSESDAESVVRVVKSAQERQWDKLRATIRTIRNALRIQDWSTIQTEAQQLIRQYDRAAPSAAKTRPPRFYIKVLAELEDAVNSISRSDTKKMSKSNATGVNRTKQLLKKYNEKFRRAIDAYKANPDPPGLDELDSEESDVASEASSEDEAIVVGAGGAKAVETRSVASSTTTTSSSDSETDSETETEWDTESSVSSDSSTDDERAKLKGRMRWVKRTVTRDAARGAAADEKKRRKPKEKKEETEATVPAEVTLTPAEAALRELRTLKLSPEAIGTKIQEVLASWGKRDADRDITIASLEYLAVKAREFGAAGEYAIPVLMQLVRARIEASARFIDSVMPVNLWQEVLHELWTVTEILDSQQGRAADLRLATVSQADVAEAVAKQRERERELKEQRRRERKKEAAAGRPAEEAPEEEDEEEEESEEQQQRRIEQILRPATVVEPGPDGSTLVRVVGNLLVFVERLSDEFIKSLQSLDPHKTEYMQRVSDEQWLIALAAKVQNYYVRVQQWDLAARASQLRLEHSYYRHSTISAGMHKTQQAAEGVVRKMYQDRLQARVDNLAEHGTITTELAGALHTSTEAVSAAQQEADVRPSLDTEVEDKTIISLAQFVYAYGTDRDRTRACLCHIYHEALHDRFVVARDLLLMSKLQDTIHMADIATQVLFNRIMAQLGAAAFRNGLIEEAHACLQDLCSSGHTKELLAQGVGRYYEERDLERERQERRRMMPYHMHIHTDLLEACHLVSAMLLEVPNMAAAESAAMGLQGAGSKAANMARRVISRFYRRQLDYLGKKPFVGPPETIREHVMVAGVALAEGDWRKSEELLLNLRSWELWTFRGVDVVKDMLRKHLRETALMTYMHTFAGYYDSLSLPRLCEMFDLEANTIHSIVSKMMIGRELPAAWDQPTSTVVMQRERTTPLQARALDYADRVAAFVESNEEALSCKQGFAFSRRDDRRDTGRGGGRFGARRGFDPRAQGNTGRSHFRGRGRGRGNGRGRGGRGRGGGGGGAARTGDRKQLNAWKR